MSATTLVRLGLLLALAAFLAACSRDTPDAGKAPAVDVAASARAVASISRPAWLRERLPEHSVGYLRIPSPWGWLAAPDGRSLDPALASDAHVAVVASLRKALPENPAIAATGVAALVDLLFSELASPIEVAMVDPGDIANPTSSVLLTAELSIDDVAALNARISAMPGNEGFLRAPLDAEGRGEVAAGGFVHFDTASRRFWFLGGMTASRNRLDALIAETARTRPAPMAAEERLVDESGQGLFFWLRLAGIGGMASTWLPASDSTALLRDFSGKAESLYGGWGSVAGKGRFLVRLRAPAARLLARFAPHSAMPPLMLAGTPSWFVNISLPDAQQWQDFRDHLDEDFGTGTRAALDEAEARLRTRHGVDAFALARLVGPALLGFEDEAGAYGALQVADPKAFHALVESMAAHNGWQYETLRSGGIDIRHLRLPGTWEPSGKAIANGDEADAWAKLYQRIGSHAYWIEDGAWLVFASVPQALVDRARARPSTPLAAVAPPHAGSSFLGFTIATRNVQRNSYYAYLGSLRALADMLDVRVDLERMPSASELDLPRTGSTGIALEASPEYIGLGLHYDATPLDGLVGSGSAIATAVVAGIVAAIAIPAYEDYAARARVSAVLSSTLPLRSYAADHFHARGSLPGEFDEQALADAGMTASANHVAQVWIDDGAIVVELDHEAPAGLAGELLVLRPYLRDGKIHWLCGGASPEEGDRPLADPEAETTIPAKLLPSNCR